MFQPCYLQVTGQDQDHDRHYTAVGDANVWDQGVTTYLDSASGCQMILVVDIGASFTHNRLLFLLFLLLRGVYVGFACLLNTLLRNVSSMAPVMDGWVI